MKQLLRTLCTACLIAAPTLAAHATDYYLRCKAIEDKLKDNTISLRDAFKFTQTSENEYQLAVEYINDDFYIGDKESDDILFGSTDAISLNYEAATSDEGTTINLSTSGENKISWPKKDEWNSYDQMQHVLFTLTVGEDGNATLKVEPITNTKLKPGVPSFWYVTINNGGLDPANRLVKENESDGYTIHFDSVSGTLRIVDGPSLYGKCMLLSSDNTTTYLKFDTVQNINISNYTGTDIYGYTTGLFYEICGNYITNVPAEKKWILITKDTELDKYSYEMKLYEDPGDEGYIRMESNWGSKDITFNDVTLHFKYDIATHTDEVEDNSTDGDENTETTTTRYNDYEIKLKGDKDSEKYKAVYNGILTISVGGIEGLSIFEDNDVYNFAITMSVDSYADDKAINLKKNSETKYIDGTPYIVYTSDYLNAGASYGFNSAFYIKGFNAETLAVAGSDSEKYTITQYAADTSADADADCIVKNYKYMIGNEEKTSNVVEFKASGTNTYKRTNLSYTDTAMQDSDYLTNPKSPYYAINNASIQVSFLYNLDNPNKSLVQVTSWGTWTGVDNVSVDGEDAPVEYYNLSGVRVDGSVPGLYIRRQGSKVSKVIIK